MRVALSSLHCLCKKCDSMPSFLLLASLGWLLPCLCQSHCHHWDGGIFTCVWDPLIHRLHDGGRGSWGHICASLFCCKFHKLCYCGAELWCGQVAEVCVLPSLLILGSLKLCVPLLWSESRIANTLSRIPSILPPPCFSVHPPLNEQICKIIWCPVVLGKGTFVEL